MNIIDIQDSLKNFSEDQLIKEMQMPSGNAPQFLVLSEIQRRKRVRDDFSKRQAAQEPTVAEEAVAAAGVPMQGIAGMSEAMAPQSAVSEGIGTIMPQAMRKAPNVPVPEAEDIAMPMRSGGLLGYGQDRIDPFLDEVGQIAAEHFGQPSETDGQDNPQQPPGFGPPMPGIFRPNRPTRPRPFDPVLTQPFMPSQPAFGSSRPRLPVKGGGVGNGSRSLRFSGLGQYAPVQRYDEGGVVKAQQGAYFPSNAELYGLYGQESGYGKNMYGSSGEIGPLQMMPTTAIQPGYGIKSLFPELQKAVQSGDYESALAAYKANKAMVDEALMSGQKVEPFVMDYLDKAEAILGNRDLALLSYNQGIDGTKGFEGDPSKTDYVSGVMGNQSGFADLLAERGVKESDLFQTDAKPNFMSAMAATPVNQTSPVPQGDQDNPIEIGTLFGKAVMSDDLGEYIVGEDGEPIYLDDNQLAGVDRKARQEPKPESTPLGDALAKEEEEANAAAKVASAVAAAAAASEAKKNDKDDKTPPWMTPSTTTPPTSTTTPVQPLAPAAPEAESEDTSIEAEILKMQDDLKQRREQDKWLAIAQAGLALMSSKEPTLLGAAGEAGVSGLKAYREAQDRYQEGVIDLVNARAKLDKSKKPAIAQKDILDAQVEIMKDPLATPTERARAKSIVDSIVGGAGFGLVDLRSQAAS